MTEGTDDAPPFDHDPTDARMIDPSAPTSFDEAKQAVDQGDADGLGFVMTRHDPFLVVEISAGRDGGTIDPTVKRILATLGPSFTETESETGLRAIYRGQLPGKLHGNDPVIVGVGSGSVSHVFRLYDSGWVPMTGRHIEGTPTDVEEIDQQRLHRLLSKAGKLDD